MVLHLEGKELCGKNVYCFEKDNKIVMYHSRKKVGELQLNDLGSITHIKIYEKSLLIHRDLKEIFGTFQKFTKLLKFLFFKILKQFILDLSIFLFDILKIKALTLILNH